MKMKRFIWIWAVVLLFSCQKSTAPAESRLVVEGWIENGGHPMVFLSESVPVEKGKPITATDLMGNLAKWAKVSVSDGEKTIYLTGMLDESHFPPYVFTSSRISGEVGKKYQLRVEYKDFVATAETTIPEPVPLDTVYLSSVQDSLCHVACGFTDPPQKGNCYKFFTRTTGVDASYRSSALAQMDDSQLDGYTEVFLYSTQRIWDMLNMPNIRQGDELWVKLCTLDTEAFSFWRNYETLLLSNAFNMDFGARIQGNIQGGLGYWIGYGVAAEVCLQL